MTPPMIAVLVLTVVSIVLFITEWLPPDVVALGVMTVLMASGILTAEQGFAGFSDASTITVAAMFVLSAAVTRTGALNYFGALLGRLFRTRFRIAYLLLLLGVGLTSGFLSNTAVVVIFLPVLLTACRDARISPSKVLIPLSYLSIAGGACTLIGTSTNIVVSSLLPRFGLEPVGMFEVTPVGLLLLIATVAFMYGPGSRLLPNGKTDSGLEQRYGIGRYLLDVTLRPGSRSAGKPLSESPLIGELGVDVFGIFRNGTSLGWPSPNTVLVEADVLRVRCDVEMVDRLEASGEVDLLQHEAAEAESGDSVERVPFGTDGDQVLVEGVIAPNSRLEGKRLREWDLERSYRAVLLAIRHRGEIVHVGLPEVRLRSGDVLLLRTLPDELPRLQRSRDFVLVSEVGLPQVDRRKVIPSAFIFGAVIAATAFDTVPVEMAAATGAILMVLTRCVSIQQAYEAMQWRVLFLLAALLSLGTALQETGGTAYLGDWLLRLMPGWPPMAVLAFTFLAAVVMTEAMSNTAAAVLLVPVAVASAEGLGLSPRPFVMAVLYGASCGFMVPVGYQTHMIVYGPGQYSFRDFVRVGLPMDLLWWVVSVLAIPYVWPFGGR